MTKIKINHNLSNIFLYFQLQHINLSKCLFVSLIILHATVYADHGALRHRVHHGHQTRSSHTRIERDHGGDEENEVIDEEPNGKIDFSQAVPQKDGSLCVTKIKYMEKLEKTQVNIKLIRK